MLKKSTHLLKDAGEVALKPLNQAELKLALSDLAEIGREEPAVAAMVKSGGPLLDFIAAAFTLSPYLREVANIDNAVLVLHWTGADSRALLSPIYMKALFDPGRPLDATRYYLIFPDSVGHGQSSKPSDGLRVKFPNYDYGDIVDLQHELVTETLGIRHLHAILGMSMGGMNAWQWAELYPHMMDGVMPGMDGLEVFRRLRALDARVPVVLTTGHPDPGIRTRARAACVPLVEKPFTFEALLAMLAANDRDDTPHAKA